jgi:hypothetical protein
VASSSLLLCGVLYGVNWLLGGAASGIGIYFRLVMFLAAAGAGYFQGRLLCRDFVDRTGLTGAAGLGAIYAAVILSQAVAYGISVLVAPSQAMALFALYGAVGAIALLTAGKAILLDS